MLNSPRGREESNKEWRMELPDGRDQHMAGGISLVGEPLFPDDNDVRRKKKRWVLMQMQQQVWCQVQVHFSRQLVFYLGSRR